MLASAAVADQAACTGRALRVRRATLSGADAAADLALWASAAVQAVATCVSDRPAAVGCTLRLAAGAAATWDLRAADLSAAALSAVDGFTAVVEFRAAITCRALRRWAISAAPHGGLAADFADGTAAAVVHLAAAVDEAPALATGLFAGLRQAAAVVDAALAAWTAAALDRATAAVGQAAAHACELLTAKRDTTHALVIEALLGARATAAIDRIARAHRADRPAFGPLRRTRSCACRFLLRWFLAAVLPAHSPARAFTASLCATAAIR